MILSTLQPTYTPSDFIWRIHKGKNQQLLTADNCGRKIVFLVELIAAMVLLFKPAIINWYESRIHDSLNLDQWFNYVINYWTLDQYRDGSSDDFSCNIKYVMLIPLVLSVSVLFIAAVMNMIIGHQYLRSNQIDIIRKIIMVYCWYSLEYDENSLLIEDTVQAVVL